MSAFIQRQDDNEAIFKRLFDDSELQGFVKDLYAWKLYRWLDAPA